MTSVFNDLLVDVDAIVDATFADRELFYFAPMSEIRDADSIEDAARNPSEAVTAIFDDQGLALMVGMEYSGANRASSSPLISVLWRYLPQGVKRGDRFLRNADGHLYEVTNVDTDGIARYVLSVVEVDDR